MIICLRVTSSFLREFFTSNDMFTYFNNSRRKHDVTSLTTGIFREMFFPDNNDISPRWNDFTLILPTVSVGNVGQLAVDLLISTLKAKHVGFLYTDCVVPVVGGDPFAPPGSQDSKQITTSVDVYESVDLNIVIVQQRAPLVKPRRGRFVSELLEWIKNCQFSRLVVLTSVFACERTDQQLTGTQTRYLLTSKAEQEFGQLFRDELNCRPMEKRVVDESWQQTSQMEPYIPGSGIARNLLNKCESAGIAASVLSIFCYEADNIADSMQLASLACSVFKWISPQLQENKLSFNIPPSWKFQYGSRLDQNIYQ